MRIEYFCNGKQKIKTYMNDLVISTSEAYALAPTIIWGSVIAVLLLGFGMHLPGRLHTLNHKHKFITWDCTDIYTHDSDDEYYS